MVRHTAPAGKRGDAKRDALAGKRGDAAPGRHTDGVPLPGMAKRTLFATSLLVFVAACGAPELTYRQDGADAGVDAVGDTSIDSPADARDAAQDAPSSDQHAEAAVPDAAEDAVVDAAFDAAEDVVVDAPDDTSTDASGDAPEDTAVDQAADSPVDSPVDGPVEGAVDAASVCPLGMVDTPRPSATIYCVDATEVRAEDYAAWLATNPPTAGQASGCAGNDFAPATTGSGCSASTYDPVGKPDHPVVCVDWCDAAAYCAGRGKRLCGDLGGGPSATNKYKNPSTNQWYRACSHAGTVTYPYGDSFVAAACNGAGYGANAAVAVTSASACAGGYPGLWDMSGNVQEWEDSCDGAVDTSLCHLRGGGFTDGMGSLRCDTNRTAERMTYGSNIGFRCCGE